MRRTTIFLFLTISAIFTGSIWAVTIGPGPTVANVGEGPGTRINVDLNAPVTLPAGTYAVSGFNSYIAQAGDIIPFLATIKAGATGNGTGTDNFTVLSSGATRKFGVSNTGLQLMTFGGSSVFTLSSPTQVFAGLTNNGAGPGPVGITLNSGSTDHNGSGFTPTVGSDTGLFSNPGLNRTYSFEFTAATLDTPFAVGPGSNLGDTLLPDSSGTRTNVDLVSAPILPAGTYRAIDFNFGAAMSGNVTPFVAIIKAGATGTGAVTDNFTVIASGTNRNVATAGTYNFGFGGFAGADTFTLSVPTQIFVGVTNDPSLPNPAQAVGFVSGVGRVDHNSPGFAALVGSDTGTFSNPDLGRTYAFDIRLQLVPEPSSIGLLSIGLAGLLGLRRRKRVS